MRVGHPCLFHAPAAPTRSLATSSTPPTPPAASRATASAPIRCPSRSSASVPSRSYRTSPASRARRSASVGGRSPVQRNQCGSDDYFFSSHAFQKKSMPNGIERKSPRSSLRTTASWYRSPNLTLVLRRHPHVVPGRRAHSARTRTPTMKSARVMATPPLIGASCRDR